MKSTRKRYRTHLILGQVFLKKFRGVQVELVYEGLNVRQDLADGRRVDD